MNTRLRAIALAMLVTIPLAGCSTSGQSSHGIDNAQTASTTPLFTEDGDLIAKPDSDNTILKGNNATSVLAKGKEHFKEQNYGLSRKFFQKVVELKTDNAAGWAGLAASYDELGRFDLADRAYKQLIKLNGNNAKVLNNRGYSYLLRGDYAKARKYFNRAQKADITLEHIQGNLHLLNKIERS